MLLVERSINGVDIAIDITKSDEIYFDEDFISMHPEISSDITPTKLCEALSTDKYTPLLLTWELTDKCSFACPFCYIVGHSNKKLVRFNEMKPHIDALLERGLLYCTLTGGEATLHPDFKEIYLYLKTKGVLVVNTTQIDPLIPF